MVKSYPQPIKIDGIDCPSRFYQKDEDGTIGPRAAKPIIPEGEFDFKEENKTIKTWFKGDNANGKAATREGRMIPPYIPSDDIKEIVRLAQILKRPILIKGEPGSGKTQLSRAVSYEWYGDEYQQHYFEWFVKSNTKAVDGLYTFDHVGRLRDAQLAKDNADLAKKMPTDYRKFGPMAMAFLTSTEENPSILLIDEIDKADMDFPNDLLLELDERRFKIPDNETGETILAKHPPIIFITSNDERDLPEAFLRRCIFLYTRFPDDTQMRLIIQAHLPALVKEQEEFTKSIINSVNGGNKIKPKDFVDLANKQFKVLKDKREKDLVDNKRVSTSELLDWLTAFNYDWQNKSGIYSEAQEYIKRYLQAQLSSNLSEEEIEKQLKLFEQESIGNYNFYSQTVLKSLAAVSARQKFNEVKTPVA